MTKTEQDPTGSSVDDANEDRLPVSENQIAELAEKGIGSKVETPDITLPEKFRELAESTDSRDPEDDGPDDIEAGGREPILRRSFSRDSGETPRRRQEDGRPRPNHRFGTQSSESHGGYGSGFGSAEEPTHVAPSGTTPRKEGRMSQAEDQDFGRMLNDDRDRSDPMHEAVRAAYAITTKFPSNDQPGEWAELEQAAEAVPEERRTTTVFRLVMPVLREDVGVQSLFALARVFHQTGIAYSTAAIANAMRAENLTTEDLIEYGLMKRQFNDGDSRSWLTPLIGAEAIKKASEKMQNEKKLAGARILRSHLNRSAEARGAAIARRERRETGNNGDDGAASDEAEQQTVPVGATSGESSDS